jgi:hypothetical protein
MRDFFKNKKKFYSVLNSLNFKQVGRGSLGIGVFLDVFRMRDALMSMYGMPTGYN